MDELIIQRHNFESAKNELKEFSEQAVSDANINHIDENKSFGEFLGDFIFGRGIGLNHKVTGEELNDLVLQIQEHLSNINDTQIRLVKEFGQVYTALEALDKDYIQAILISVKATEETSRGVQNAQGQIKKVVENQKKTLEELKKFKHRIDGYTHIGDVDKIWTDCQSNQERIKALSKPVADTAATLTAAEKKIENLCRQSDELIKKLEPVAAFSAELERITHLKDVDEMWELLSSSHNSINNILNEYDSIQSALSRNQEDIKDLSDFTEKMSQLDHLMDIDGMWNRSEDNLLRVKELEQTINIHADTIDELKKEDSQIRESVLSNTNDIELLKDYKAKLSDLSHIEDIDEMWGNVEDNTYRLVECEEKTEEITAIIQKNKNETDVKITDAVQKTKTGIDVLTRRLKYAYFAAGGAAGLAILEFILLLLKVI